MRDEQERLQKLYAGLNDGELLKLAGSKGGLTAVAQQAVEAEVSARGLAMPVGEVKPGTNVAASGEPAGIPAEKSAAEEDPTLVELMTFQIAMEAQKALHELDEHGIPVQMEPALRRLTEDGPRIRTNWLTIFVERTRQEEARSVLRKSMGLFPVLAADEVDDGDGDEGEETLLPVGSFDVQADVETARAALTGAGIWFRSGEEDEDATLDAGGVTTIEVRPEDLERALAVVETAFAEAE